MSSSRNSSFVDNSSHSEISGTLVPNNSSVVSGPSVPNNSSLVSGPSVPSKVSVVSVPEGCVTLQSFPFISWDNEDNLVPKEVDNIINLVFTGIVLPLLFIVSLCTNIINMVVFYKHGLKERINACLFTLSLVDLLSITVVFAYCSDVTYMFVIGKGGELGPSAQFFIRNDLIGLHSFLLASQMVYSVITVERCLCVTQLLLVKTFMSTKTTAVVLWAMVFTITGYTVFISAVQYNVQCVFDASVGRIFYINYPTEFYFLNKPIIDVLYGIVTGLVFPMLALICVTVCTIITAVKLKKLSQWRDTVSSASGSVSSRDLALTRVIIGTSILFIVCIVPSVVMIISFLIVPDLGLLRRYDNMAWVFRRFFQLSTAVNSTFNFFMYYMYGSKFRETTHCLFSSCCPVGSSRDKTTTSSSLEK